MLKKRLINNNKSFTYIQIDKSTIPVHFKIIILKYFIKIPTFYIGISIDVVFKN